MGLDLGTIVTGLGGGLALFLFGMRHMTEALKTVAGGRMKALLARLTANRFTGVLAGTLVTAVIQSSSVTTVLVVGFLTAGLMTFSQSIGVVVGANVGTTVTAQIIAFRVNQYGLILIAIGFLMETSLRHVRIRQWGAAVMGLGLLFFGMELMSTATGPLRTYPPVLEALAAMRHPLPAVLVGAVFTALVQSSSATTGMVIIMAADGLLSLEAGIGLILGANIGTCVTALISAVGRPREAMRAAVAHVVFNVAGVAAWAAFVPQLAGIARGMAPEDVSRQIANAHTVFNVSNAFVFIWFVGPVSSWIARWVPVPPAPAPIGQPRFLDDYFVDQPALALDRVRMELGRLGRLVGDMVRESITVVIRGDERQVRDLARRDDEINALQGAIVRYLRRIAQEELADPQPSWIQGNLAIATYLENVGDVVDDDLMEVARKRLRLDYAVSPDTEQRLRLLHERVGWAFDRAQVALETADLEAAREAAESKAPVKAIANDLTSYLAARLSADAPHRVTAFQLESDIVENLTRINTLTRRIARVVLASPAGPPSSPG